MKVLFDTNVVLDVLLARQPHALPAARLISRVDRGRLAGYVGATTVTTLYYLAARAQGRQSAVGYLDSLLALFDVAKVDAAVLDAALRLDFEDFEDAVLHEAARAAGANCIVTRDRRGFAAGSIPIHAPDELLAMLRARE